MSSNATKKRKSIAGKSQPAAKKRKSTSTPKKVKEEDNEQRMKVFRDRMSKIPADELTNDSILSYVTETEPPFVIRTHQLPKRAKGLQDKDDIADLLPESHHLHYDAHNPRLTIAYEVHPANVWEHLRRFKKFTVGDPERGSDVSAEPADYILVKNDDTPEESTLEREAQWKAQVLEIRALDQEHVYIRVAWLNRPKDLEKGDIKHYGKFELIPTNQLDIIDAMTVNGKVAVVRWDENDDDSDAPSDQHFWRHVYDQANTKTFIPPLKKVCACVQPINPDQTLVQCGADDCHGWLHVTCIVKDAHDNRQKHLILETDLPAELEYSRDELDQSATGRYEGNKGVTHIFVRGSDRGSKSTIVYSHGEQREARPVLCLICGAEVP